MYSKYASHIYLSNTIVVFYTNGYIKSILYINKIFHAIFLAICVYTIIPK
jgi:hypothetical protein